MRHPWDWRTTFEALRTVQQQSGERGFPVPLVLLPFAQAMVAARRHWLDVFPDGVCPRFETTSNWLTTLPPRAAQEWDLAMDTGRDLATAWRWLDQVPTLRADAKWSEHLAAQLVQAIHSLAALAQAQHPDQRQTWAAHMAQKLVPEGTALLRWEAAVQRLAWLWVGQSGFATDVLWDARLAQQWPVLCMVPGWSDDALTRALLSHWQSQGARSEVLPQPVLTPSARFSKSIEHAPMPRLQACTDVQDEALEAACSVMQALGRGATQVGLVALDRAVTRRTVALLATRGVEVRDETGWPLSTSRLGAAVMAVLRAARPGATTDEWVNALLHMPSVPAEQVLAQEQVWRDWGDWRPMARADDAAWLCAVRACLARLHAPRAFTHWQQDVAGVLTELGVMSTLEADAVGQRLIEAAAWQQTWRGDLPRAWQHMSLSRYLSWLREAWEGVLFRPAFTPQARVVVVPLAQLLMRDLDALVLPGCDHNSLPVAQTLPGPWTHAQREAAGLLTRVGASEAFAQAWQAVLSHPEAHLLWRTQDGGETLGPSHWVLRHWPQAQAMVAPAVGAGGESAEMAPVRDVAVQPSARPAAALQAQDVALLPSRVSASRYQRLRACPYQFFVADVLGLSADEELDEMASRRDMGLWLHAVLQQFHAQEPEAVLADPQRCSAQLDVWAERVRLSLGLDAVAFLPFQASWPLLREGYVQWLQTHRQSDARTWLLEHHWTQPLSDTVAIHGQLDRVDRSDLDGRQRLWVMDYKTERAEAARKRARSGTEDTQLAFYAALAQQAQPQAEIRAAYVCVGDANRDAREPGTRWEEHPNVMEDAQRVMQGVLQDWQALRSGAAMSAMGEPPACDHCRARGLCRRDLWEVEHG